MDLAVVVEAHGVAVGEAPAAALHREVGLHLHVRVHRAHDAVDVAEGVDTPGAVAVLGVEHGVGVVVVVRARDVDLVHRGDGLDVVAVLAEALPEHARHRLALHDVRERVAHLTLETLVPPVRGLVPRGVLRGDEVVHRLERRAILLARQLAAHDVVVRHDPRREGFAHVHQRVEAEGKEVVRVLEQERGPAERLELVRALERLLVRDEVRELLAHVPGREELERGVRVERGRELVRDDDEAAHPGGGGEPEADVLEREEEGNDVRAHESLVRVLSLREVLAERDQRGDDAHRRRHHVQRDVQGVGVVRPELLRDLGKLPHLPTTTATTREARAGTVKGRTSKRRRPRTRGRHARWERASVKCAGRPARAAAFQSVRSQTSVYVDERDVARSRQPHVRRFLLSLLARWWVRRKKIAWKCSLEKKNAHPPRGREKTAALLFS